MVWVQVNGPIIWPWAKKYKLLLMLCGVPITYLFMEATRLAVGGFEGLFWKVVGRNCRHHIQFRTTGESYGC